MSGAPTVGTAGAPGRWLGGRARRFFWLDERMARAVRDGLGPDDPRRPDYERGCAALDAAERLRHAPELLAGRLLLLRAATAALAQAAQTPATPTPPLTGDHRAEFEFAGAAVRAAERLRELDGADAGTALLDREASWLLARAAPAPATSVTLPASLELAEAERSRLEAWLATDGASRLATADDAERRQAERLLAFAARALLVPLRADAASVQRVWRARWIRLSLCLAVVVLPPILLLVREPPITGPNLAFRRPVTMSSEFTEGNVGRDPSALVDGDTQRLGFHTDRGGPQQVTIDLGSAQTVRAVVVHNRTDCCAEKAVPLRVEVSVDGGSFRQVATRRRSFDVWRATFSAVSDRYVRLVNTGGDYFHLAEVEVH